MIGATEWKRKTALAMRTRSAELKAVDDALKSYQTTQSQHALAGLCGAMEAWSKSKQPAGELNGGAAYLINGDRNKGGAVARLITDIIQAAGKPPYWPDQTPGAPGERDYTYVVEGGLNDTELNLLRQARESAAKRSVTMISKMEVDWSKFAFDQIGSVSSAAIDLGHTKYDSSWDKYGGSNPNSTSAGQFFYGCVSNIFTKAMGLTADEVKDDPRVENALAIAGLSVSALLGVLKYHLFNEGVMSKTVPLFGQVKGATDALAKGTLEIRVAAKSNQRVGAAKPLLQATTPAAEAMDLFGNLIKIETTKNISEAGINLLVNTAGIVMSVFATPAITIVNVVKTLVDVFVSFVYQVVYYIVFKDAVRKCREWVDAGAAPADLDFRGWCANCPLLGAYFFVGLAGTAGAPTALAMFGQSGVPMTSTHFQDASVKLLKVRQSAAFFITRSPVKIGWVDQKAKKEYGWIEDGFIKNEAKSASVGLKAHKIHHYTETGLASSQDKFKHKILVVGEKCYSLFKHAWDVV